MIKYLDTWQNNADPLVKYDKLKKKITEHPNDFVLGVTKLGAVESTSKLFHLLRLKNKAFAFKKIFS